MSTEDLAGTTRFTRRQLLTGTIGFFVRAASAESTPVFDIHCHSSFPTHSEKLIVEHQRSCGIRTSALLPLNSAAAHIGLLPSFNIAQDSAIQMARKYAGEFVWFAVADPRKKTCSQILRKYLEAGASGIGEMEFQIDCDSPKMEVVYKLAEEFRVPVLLHFEFGASNTGFERFPRVVAKYPGVRFIGHAQTWWGNIDLHHPQEQVWPEPSGPVEPGGITDRLLADFPNVYGDLSAHSGLNLLRRDEDYARTCLQRHQNKLLFGSDCVHKGMGGRQCWAQQTLAALHRLAPSDAILTKILWQNARQLLRLG